LAAGAGGGGGVEGGILAYAYASQSGEDFESGSQSSLGSDSLAVGQLESAFLDAMGAGGKSNQVGEGARTRLRLARAERPGFDLSSNSSSDEFRGPMR
jgi:hypothetical protein